MANDKIRKMTREKVMKVLRGIGNYSHNSIENDYNKKALYIKLNGETRFVGKIIEDCYIREFPFNRAVKWATREISVDSSVYDHINKDINRIVFTDTDKKKTYVIGKRTFNKYMRKADYGEGEQYYISKEKLKRVKFRITPYISNKNSLCLNLDIKKAIYKNK